MRPILFHIFDYPVYSYGVALIVALSVCTGLVIRHLPQKGFSFSDLVNICLISMASIMFGSKFMMFLFAPEHSVQGFFNIFKIWERGSFAVSWALFPAIGFMFFYCRITRLPFLTIMDFLVPYALLGMAIQRCFGCFLAGCCYGIPTDLPWGIVFPETSRAGMHFPDLTIHPTQLYYGFSALIIWAGLHSYQRHQKNLSEGVMTASGGMLFGLNYFCMTFWRGDLIFQNTLLGFTHSQYAAFGLSCASFMLYITVKRQHRS